jgi:hypothetical protein
VGKGKSGTKIDSKFRWKYVDGVGRKWDTEFVGNVADSSGSSEMDEVNAVYRVETEEGYMVFRGEFAYESAMDWVEAHGGRIEVCDGPDEDGSWTFLD